MQENTGCANLDLTLEGIMTGDYYDEEMMDEVSLIPDVNEKEEFIQFYTNWAKTNGQKGQAYCIQCISVDYYDEQDQVIDGYGDEFCSLTKTSELKEVPDVIYYPEDEDDAVTVASYDKATFSAQIIQGPTNLATMYGALGVPGF